MRLYASLCMVALLSGCTDVGQQQELQRQKADIARLEKENTAEDFEIAKLKQSIVDLQKARASRPTSVSGDLTEPLPSMTIKAGSRYPGKCYKDYCPCDPPQGGPDTVLCDQLENGEDPDIDLMIAGRGMREARREIQTGDY